MKTILTLFFKDWRVFRNDTVAVVISFIVPLALVYIIGSIFIPMGEAGGGPSGYRLAIVNQSDSAVVKAMIEGFEEEGSFRLITTKTLEDGSEVPITEEDVREDISQNRYRFALIFPEDAMGQGFGLKLRLLQNPRNSVETQMVQGLMQKNLFSTFFQNLTKMDYFKADPAIVGPFNEKIAEVVSSQFGLSKEDVMKGMSEDSFIPKILTENLSGGSSAAGGDGEGDTESSSGAGDFFSQLIKVDQENLYGEELKNPMAVQTIAGYAVMFTLFSLTGAASSLFEEKQAGVFLRILTSPATRASVLWSKFLFNLSLGFLQINVLFLFGWFLFKVEIFANYGVLLVLSLLISAVATSFGMLLSSFSKTQAQANGFGTLFILAMSALGGAWFPSSMMPDGVQLFSKITLVYWSVDALLMGMFELRPLMDIWLNMSVLVGMTVLFMGVSLFNFRRGDLF